MHLPYKDRLLPQDFQKQAQTNTAACWIIWTITTKVVQSWFRSGRRYPKMIDHQTSKARSIYILLSHTQDTANRPQESHSVGGSDSKYGTFSHRRYYCKVKAAPHQMVIHRQNKRLPATLQVIGPEHHLLSNTLLTFCLEQSLWMGEVIWDGPFKSRSPRQAKRQTLT